GNRRPLAHGGLRPGDVSPDRSLARGRVRHPHRRSRGGAQGGRSRMMASFRAAFRKEMLHLRRNKAGAWLAIMMPVMQLTMYGFIDQTVHDEPTIIVDQDRSVHSRELIDKLRSTKTFAIREITDDPREARTEITAGRAGVGIVIPPNFHDAQVRGTS